MFRPLLLCLFFCSSLLQASLTPCVPEVLAAFSQPYITFLATAPQVVHSPLGPALPHEAALAPLTVLMEQLEAIENSPDGLIQGRGAQARAARESLARLFDLAVIPYDQYIFAGARAHEAISGKNQAESIQLLPVTNVRAFPLRSRIALGLQGIYLFDLSHQDEGLSDFFKRLESEVSDPAERRHILLVLNWASEHQIFQQGFHPTQLKRTASQLLLPHLAGEFYRFRAPIPFRDPSVTESQLQYGAYKLRSLLD